MTSLSARVSADVIGEVIDGEAVLLNLTTGIYFGLNASGTLTWQSLCDTGSGERAVDELVARWGIPPERARKDVADLIATLEARGLLQQNAG
jgi:hypothetical protein